MAVAPRRAWPVPAAHAGRAPPRHTRDGIVSLPRPSPGGLRAFPSPSGSPREAPVLEADGHSRCLSLAYMYTTADIDRVETDSAAALCRPAADGFLAVASCDAKGRVRLCAAGPQLVVASGARPHAWTEGVVVLATDPTSTVSEFAPRLRVDGRDRLCLTTAWARWLPEGLPTVVRFDPAARRLVLLDAGMVGEWVDRIVHALGAGEGWWSDEHLPDPR